MKPADLSTLEPSGTDSRPMPTYGDYAAQWQRAYNRPPWVSARTAYLRDQILKTQVLPFFGDVPLDAIAVPDVVRWQQAMLSRGIGIGYAKFLATALAAPLKQAYREGLIPQVPTNGIRWPRRRSKNPDPYTPREMRRMINWFRAHNPQHLPLVILVARVGMRPSEACGLLWSDVDLDHGYITIERSSVDRQVGETKTDRSRRRVRVVDEVLEVLATTPRRSKFVVVASDGRPMPSTGFSYHWKKACEAAGVRYRGFYRARAGFLTRAVARGGNLIHVAQYSGTSVEMLSRHYVRWMGAQEIPGERVRKRAGHRAKRSIMSPTLFRTRGPKA